ncbi:MAG: hypothetical protein R2911_00290 [Caldilineaceae bacterium]
MTILPGVGGVTAEQLGRLGIQQVIDLLWHLPARHEDFSTMRTISRLQRTGDGAGQFVGDSRAQIGMNRQMVQGAF